MCVQQSFIQCACHYYGSFASVIKSVVSRSLIRCVKLRSGVSGGFKRRGPWGLTSPLCRILPQKIFKKALYICEPPPPFSTFRICKFWLLTIFQTAWHFASASRLKCSHDYFQTDSDWIFKINEICISNRKPTNTLTNRIQSAFGVFSSRFYKTRGL